MEIGRPKYQVSSMNVPDAPADERRFSREVVSPDKFEVRRMSAVAAEQIGTILEQESALDRAMSESLRGDTLDQREMLELQATVYSYSQRVDVATRVIDRGASALKQLLNTQL